MRYEGSDQFKADWRGLSEQERECVRTVLPRFNAAADDVAAQGFDPHRWPSALRVHDLRGAPGVWSVTFNFVGPDLRATFEWASSDGEPTVLWRRIGRHPIYRAP